MARVKITEKQTTNVLEDDACFVVTQTPSGEEEADIRRLPLAALPKQLPAVSASDNGKLVGVVNGAYGLINAVNVAEVAR